MSYRLQPAKCKFLPLRQAAVNRIETAPGHVMHLAALATVAISAGDSIKAR